jgi:hypothetical protein
LQIFEAKGIKILLAQIFRWRILPTWLNTVHNIKKANMESPN